MKYDIEHYNSLNSGQAFIVRQPQNLLNVFHEKLRNSEDNKSNVPRGEPPGMSWIKMIKYNN